MAWSRPTSCGHRSFRSKTRFAYILPTLVFNGFYIILFKSNFATNIHPALIEAAKIDGANGAHIYRKIILPISLPIIAAIGLMVGIGCSTGTIR